MPEVLSTDRVTSLVRLHFNPIFTLYNSIRKVPGEVGNTAAWDQVDAHRTMADYNIPDNEAGTQANATVTKRKSEMLYQREKKRLTGRAKYWLRQPGTEDRARGEEMVSTETADLKNIGLRLAEYSCFQALAGGVISATGRVAFSLDFSMPAANKPTTATAWSDPAADIIEDIRAWKAVVRLACGLEPKHFYCSDTVQGYILKNTSCQAYYRSQLGADIMRRGELPSPFLGMEPHLYDMGDANTGTFSAWLDDGHVLLTPSFDEGDWIEIQEGASADIRSNGSVGWFSKIYQEEDPPAEMILEDYHWLPCLKVASAPIYADIAP